MHLYDYSQSFAGFVSKSLVSNYSLTGPTRQGAKSLHTAILVSTWQIKPYFSVVDEVHYGSWQEPAQFLGSGCSFFSTSLTGTPVFFNSTATLPATCTPPVGATAGIPVNTSKSDPDILVNTDSNFLKQQTTSNLIEGQVHASEKMGAYFGYKYTHREIADNFYNTQSAVYFPGTARRGNCSLANGVLPAGCTQNADGSVSFQTPNPIVEPPGITDISYNGAVLGLWLKPSKRLSINLDGDIATADNTFTPLESPELPWTFALFVSNTAPQLGYDFSSYFETTNGQNPASEVNGSQHNWSTGFSASVTPSEKLSAQLGYNYNDIYSRLLVCFTSDFAQPGLPACPGCFRPGSGNLSIQQQSEQRIHRPSLEAAATIIDGSRS